MNDIIKSIENLFFNYKNIQASNIVKLPQSGGDRIYYRISYKDEDNTNTAIATYSNNIKENKFFIYCTEHFFKKHLSVPVIYAVSEDFTIYIQEDLGNNSLLEILKERGKIKDVFELYKTSLKALSEMQIKGSENFDFKQCLVSEEFDEQQVLNDLNYFKYYFLDLLKLDYNKNNLAQEFKKIATILGVAPYKYFMFRDFQGRNIMVKNEEVNFIDYQGGMKGPIAYDVASLLWQAKAELPEEWKKELQDYYFNCIQKLIPDVNKIDFIESYNNFTFLRMLQVLGAYGFRGLFERKTHFLSSISSALVNLKSFQQNILPGVAIPELRNIISKITEDDIVERFANYISNKNNILVVNINSFSFITRGYPEEKSDNGGGFVFDCRGILNPGRIEEYKQLTGRDEPVIKYLQQKTKMDEWLDSIFSVVDVTVENYIQRDFSNLTINFGCTGGRHRSVYAADALNYHLKEKFGIKTVVKHLEQNFDS